MLRNKFRRGSVKKANGRGSGRIQRSSRKELKVSAKVASPARFLFPYKTDGTTDVTIWRRFIAIAKRECPTIGRAVDELDEVERSNFAAIEDDDDRYFARQVYLKKWRRISIFWRT